MGDTNKSAIFFNEIHLRWNLWRSLLHLCYSCMLFLLCFHIKRLYFHIIKFV